VCLERFGEKSTQISIIENDLLNFVLLKKEVKNRHFEYERLHHELTQKRMAFIAIDYSFSIL